MPPDRADDVVAERAEAEHAVTPAGGGAIPTRPATVRGVGWLWPVFGFAGSVLLTLAAPVLVDGGVIRWWFSVRILPGHTGQLVAFYAGMVALCLAWLGLGRRLQSGGGAGQRDLMLVGVLWALPLALGPSVFSGDVYSYMAQGMILHLGHNPYHVDPVVLRRLGESRLLDAVSPFWRHTPAPYGPLFLWLAGVVVAGLNASLVAAVLVLRLLEIAGVALLAVFVPRLARLLGTDPALATWMAVLSPIVLLELVAAGHNDALMVGLMVAGVTLAMERRPLTGVALCALAATIKLPALVAVLFIAASWARERDGWQSRLFALGSCLGLAVAVLAAVSAATGVGVSWLSSGVVTTPAKVHLAVTPVTAVSWTAGWLLHAAGVAVHWRSIQSALGALALAATATAGLVLLWRVRFTNLVASLGALLLLAAAAGPAAWPWYFAWGWSLVAALAWPQRSRLVPVALVLVAFEVKPDGILALPVQASPAVLVLYVVLVLVAWQTLSRRRRRAPATEDTGTMQRSVLL